MHTRPLFLLAALACSSTKTTSDGSSGFPEITDGIADDGDNLDDDEGDDDSEDDEPSDPSDEDEDEDDTPDDTPDDDDDTPDDQDDEDDTPDDEDDTPDDTPDDDTDTPDDDDDDIAPPTVDLTVSGSSALVAYSGEITSSGGSTVEYERFVPDAPATSGEVFILHGFMRGKDQFTELANHLASWGITATAMTMMHSSLVDIDPVENAEDVIDLVDHFGAEKVVWMGHSNGGISALIAAAMAPDVSAAILGLDPVEAIGTDGAEWADDVTVPVGVLVGEEDTCNSNNSGLPTYISTSPLRAFRVTEADHCNFESPTNWLCTVSCSRDKTLFSDEAISDTITEMSTSWAMGHLVGDFDMGPWWDATGSAFLELESAGALTSL